MDQPPASLSLEGKRSWQSAKQSSPLLLEIFEEEKILQYLANIGNVSNFANISENFANIEQLFQPVCYWMGKTNSCWSYFKYLEILQIFCFVLKISIKLFQPVWCSIPERVGRGGGNQSDSCWTYFKYLKILQIFENIANIWQILENFSSQSGVE